VAAIIYKTADDIALMRHSCELVGKTHGIVASHLKPGVKTIRLDEIAEEFIRDNKAIPSFKGYRDTFPASLCISINEQVVHGIPGKYELRDGDIVSIDCGVYANGFHGDSAYTYCIGEVKEDTKALLSATKQSLQKAIAQAIVGKRIGDIGFAIQQHVEALGYSVIRELLGHGVGRDLHEAPEVHNFGKRGQGVKLLEGLVLAIEPMIALGKRDIVCLEDGWTIITADRKPAAHFEHTILVRKNEAEVLTTFKFIEEAIKNNPELTYVE
jgi:methionyl aminopeptidase